MLNKWIPVGLSCALAACGAAQEAGEPAAAAAAPAAIDAGLPLGDAAAAGMSAARLDRIGPAMQAYVDDGRAAGIMTMVARRGHVVHWDAVGLRDMAAGDPLEPDDVFRIYSMTKPITSVAVMALVEDGKLALDSPLADFIPEFGSVEVLQAGDVRAAPERPITIRHLLTHTSGLTYGFFGDSAVDRLYREAGFFEGAAGLADFGRRAAAVPLMFSPGDGWNYGISTDILGRVIEVAAGQPLDAFLRSRILEPLGMDDTAFVVPEAKRDRFTGHYARQDGALALIDSPLDGEYTRPRPWLSGGGGLASTASDYIRFAQMLLGGGSLDGTRILAPETVQAMRTNHLPDEQVPIALGGYLSPGYGFGLGFAVLVDAGLSPEPDNDGVFRWAGAANTFFWIDPAAELIGMVWTQLNPFAGSELEREFQTLVYAALD